MNSIHTLFESPYNKQRPVFALVRFVYWKLIRLFKRKDVKYQLWDNCLILLNYDSFQSMWIMYNYFVDWEEFNLIKKYLKQNDTVFDIGSNMGFYTIWMSKFLVQGKIHAFEPDPENFKRLQKNIALNNFQNLVEANQSAVSDVDGELWFTSGLDGENHIVDLNLQNTLSIKSQKLDSYVYQHHISTSIAYMKIDVEGFEYAVLKGANSILINKQIEIIQLEINKTIKYSGKDIDHLLTLLNFYQYSLCSYDVNANQLRRVEFKAERENYFAVNDIEKINLKLKS